MNKLKGLDVLKRCSDSQFKAISSTFIRNVRINSLVIIVAESRGCGGNLTIGNHFPQETEVTALKVVISPVEIKVVGNRFTLRIGKKLFETQGFICFQLRKPYLKFLYEYETPEYPVFLNKKHKNYSVRRLLNDNY